MEQAKPYIELTDVDRRCYAERLAEFLPAELVDIHAHVWRAVDVPPLPPTDGAARTVTWPSLVARENPIEDLLESYRVLLPGKQVTPLIFGMPPEGGKLEVQNQYVSACAQQEHVPALIFSDRSQKPAMCCNIRYNVVSKPANVATNTHGRRDDACSHDVTRVSRPSTEPEAREMSSSASSCRISSTSSTVTIPSKTFCSSTTGTASK